MASKATNSLNLRYKRPALMALGYDFISNELYEISNACADVQWFVDNDNETLLNALDGDDDAEYEFRMAFTDIQAKVEMLDSSLRDLEIRNIFDDCTVGLIGNRYKSVGFDSVEEDYYSMTSYEQELAFTESGKKLMRYTKQEMISTIDQCVGITLAFLDIRQSYDYLKATFDILKNENTSLLMIIKEIESAYDAALDVSFSDNTPAGDKFSRMIANLPDNVWLA